MWARLNFPTQKSQVKILLKWLLLLTASPKTVTLAKTTGDVALKWKDLLAKHRVSSERNLWLLAKHASPQELLPETWILFEKHLPVWT
jgi:hypothetical protein